ncbi:beta-lactamase-like protein [Achlya hypogyna]|uniref:Beta-lactamase-like protein n=1 Tax=Achlya hypogyna TaxID=1202772 RepID=A0A1V9ZS96_ACHHY|nr:beta-lactamase-like protein [Achlya hypogyna]
MMAEVARYVPVAGGLLVLAALLQQYERLAALAANSSACVKLRARATSWLVAISGTSESLTRLPIVEKVAPNVIRVLGLNPGRMTLQGTNTYLVGTGRSRILVDTGDGSNAYLATLLAVLAAEDIESISDIVLTHGHFDHIGGVWQLQERFPRARVWKMLTYTPTPPCECSAHVSNTYASRKLHIRDLSELISQGQALTTDGASLRPLYTPGHTNDHVCFVLNGTAIFTGDCVLGEGTCTFQSLTEYMMSLRVLQAQAPTRLYPGHGPVIENAADTIAMYLAHRQKREDEILAVLNAQGRANVTTIVAAMYPSLPWMLSIAAARNVRMHLRKLVDEKAVVETSPEWSWVSWHPAPVYALATTTAK